MGSTITSHGCLWAQFACAGSTGPVYHHCGSVLRQSAEGVVVLSYSRNGPFDCHQHDYSLRLFRGSFRI